jgi:hypothetical protein
MAVDPVSQAIRVATDRRIRAAELRVSFCTDSLDEPATGDMGAGAVPPVIAVEISELLGLGAASSAAVLIGDLSLTLWTTKVGIQPVLFARLRRLD